MVLQWVSSVSICCNPCHLQSPASPLPPSYLRDLDVAFAIAVLMWVCRHRPLASCHCHRRIGCNCKCTIAINSLWDHWGRHFIIDGNWWANGTRFSSFSEARTFWCFMRCNTVCLLLPRLKYLLRSSRNSGIQARIHALSHDWGWIWKCYRV